MSGPASMRMLPLADSMSAAVRRRESRESLDVHTGQVQPIMGIPVDVPVPKRVTRIVFSHVTVVCVV